MATREELRLPVPHQGVEHVSALVDRTEGRARAVFVLAHGAGAPATSAFLEAVAPLVADAARVDVMRFNYAYAEQMARSGKRRPPEQRPALESVHRAALEHARSAWPDVPLLAGGKSLGGRIASLLVAAGEPVTGLVFLGYPLHPPGKPERLRTEHFPEVGVPSLFLQGTRDALADLDLVRGAIPALAGPATLHVVEGADHGFGVLRREGRTPEEVLDELATAIAGWCDGTL